MANSTVLEHSLLRTPYESVHMVTRNTQKLVAKEITDVVTEVKRLSRAAKEKAKGANLINATKSITSIVRRLKGLKRKMEEGKKTAAKYVTRCQARLEHLDKISKCARMRFAPESSGSVLKCNTRDPLASAAKEATFLKSVDAMLVGHLMRQGCLDSASILTKEAEILDFVDTEVFHSARRVIEGLRNHDCKPALAWCGANRSRLRRSHCALEADLRVQQFVELLRANEIENAIAYAREHLSISPESHLQTLLHAMGAIAFVPLTNSLPKRYRYLFEQDKWIELERIFRNVLFKLNGLSQQSTLAIRLQAGLEALKTPICGGKTTKLQEGGAKDEQIRVASECPVCARGMYNLAAPLPTSHRTQSCIVCRMCGKVMDENNRPFALPNGNVYSRMALEQNMKHNDGKVIDPRTGEIFEFSRLRSVYIL